MSKPAHILGEMLGKHNGLVNDIEITFTDKTDHRSLPREKSFGGLN